MSMAYLDGPRSGVDRARDHDADRDLAIVRCIRRVRAAGTRVEADLSVDFVREVTLERAALELRNSMTDGWKREVNFHEFSVSRLVGP